MTIDDLMVLNKRLRDYENVEEVVVINKNATNGDVIKALFPNKQFASVCSTRIYDFTTDNKIDCDLEWWNAPYKRGENE